jgi:hypothetical protein
MASQAVMRYAVKRVAQAFRSYASAQGWGPDEYRIFLSVNEDWGQIHVIFVAKAFPKKRAHDQWLDVLNFVEKELKDDKALVEALHLVLRTFDEVEEGGLNGIPRNYEDVDDLVPPGRAAGK